MDFNLTPGLELLLSSSNSQHVIHGDNEFKPLLDYMIGMKFLICKGLPLLMLRITVDQFLLKCVRHEWIDCASLFSHNFLLNPVTDQLQYLTTITTMGKYKSL